MAVTDARKLEQKQRAVPGGLGQTILLVDDETAILEMSKLMLEAHNYRILTAKDGVEAMAIFKEHHVEIKAVITDMMMPTMSGPELIRNLRQIDPNIRIIGVSGLGSEAVKDDLGNLVVQAFLKKPFSTESLLVKLHQLVG